MISTKHKSNGSKTVSGQMNTNTINILVVDDEPIVRNGIDRLLSDLKINLPEFPGEAYFSIETATSGEEALNAIKAKVPDILLLDLKLPKMSGLDVLRKI